MIATRADGLRLDTDPSRIDVDLVHHWLSTDAFWALGRSRETVARSIENSLVFGVYAMAAGEGGDSEGPDEQLAFARVVTDYATFGWLCDVYVAREARGRGIGTWLAQAVVTELAPYRLKRLMLATADAHQVYARVGFQPFPDPDRLMIVAGPAAGPVEARADPSRVHLGARPSQPRPEATGTSAAETQATETGAAETRSTETRTMEAGATAIGRNDGGPGGRAAQTGAARTGPRRRGRLRRPEPVKTGPELGLPAAGSPAAHAPGTPA